MLVCATASLEYSIRSGKPWYASACALFLQRSRGAAWGEWSDLGQNSHRGVSDTAGTYFVLPKALLSWTNYNNKERALESITFCKKPKTVSLTLCLSALNTEVAKIACFLCVFFLVCVLYLPLSVTPNSNELPAPPPCCTQDTEVESPG